MPVANGVPLAAIGAREEVPPCCVTVISAYACRQVALVCETVFRLRGRHLYGNTRRSALSVTVDRGPIETVSYRNARGFFQILG